MRTLNIIVSLAMILVLITMGCETFQSRDVEEAGFLGDYSMLKKGKGDEALLTYTKPGFDPTKYDKVLIKPVKIWVKPDTDMSKVSKKDQKMLVDYFHKVIHDELKKVKEIVIKPGPGVLVIRAALTQAEKSNVVMDSISSIVPVGLVLSEGATLATGTAGFAGSASAEVEITDSVTGERLAAAVDKRQGGKDFGGLFSSWDDVDAAMKAWAEEMGKRLSTKPK